MKYAIFNNMSNMTCGHVHNMTMTQQILEKYTQKLLTVDINLCLTRPSFTIEEFMLRKCSLICYCLLLLLPQKKWWNHKMLS